jgi:hypothetical protein
VVTGHDSANQALIVSDGPPPRIYDDLGQDGLVFYEVWHTYKTPALIERSEDEPMEVTLSLLPPAGGTRIRVLDIPPDQSNSDYEKIFSRIGASDVHRSSAPSRHPNMHRTETVDYGIVLQGEITLILEQGETILRAGDIVVQRGTNHAWSNRSGATCRMAFILVDGVFEDNLR